MSPPSSDEKNRLLEFQLRMLKDGGLIAGSCEDADGLIRNLAAAARDVLDIYFLYTFDAVEDGKHQLRFFWCGTPSDSCRKRAVQTVTRIIAAAPSVNENNKFSVVNSMAAPACLSDVDAADLDVRSQPFKVGKPESSGMVGIGLRKNRHEQPEDLIAVESILATLVNTVRSSRILADYRRDIELFATRDPLTNLYNQVAFWDRLVFEIERAKRQEYKFSLLLIDFDNFKAINDSYGHDVGDILLKEFASILKSAVRAGDIAARNGGDQFIAILPVCDEGQAYLVARRILDDLREFSETRPHGVVIKLTVSIGLAVFPDHAQQAKDLYLLADRMVLKSKTSGKDTVSMPSEHDDIDILKRMGDKNILVHNALSLRKIVPYFQAIVNMKSRKIEAYEVLTRIVMDDRVIPAAEFIETAESMGAIGKLDCQLIDRAFEKVKSSGYEGFLFLNLSPKAMMLSEFMPRVRKLLRDHNVDPSKMVFEITERDTVKGLDVIERHIRDLRGEGFRFAIDDFGAGYSSFQYLRRFSVDFLKVDGDFIRNMNGQGNIEKSIVSSIASLSEKLGIKTIAEFVESEDILGLVESAGIHYAQGYYIEKPSPDLH